jgi:hypothetical protein
LIKKNQMMLVIKIQMIKIQMIKKNKMNPIIKIQMIKKNQMKILINHLNKILILLVKIQKLMMKK